MVQPHFSRLTDVETGSTHWWALHFINCVFLWLFRVPHLQIPFPCLAPSNQAAGLGRPGSILQCFRAGREGWDYLVPHLHFANEETEAPRGIHLVTVRVSIKIQSFVSYSSTLFTTIIWNLFWVYAMCRLSFLALYTYVLTYLMLTIRWGRCYYCPHFAEEATEAGKG